MPAEAKPGQASSKSRRVFSALASAWAVGPLWFGHAAATAGEIRRLVIGYPPGPFDTMCRRLAESLKEQTGVATIVENRVGAAGRLAVDAVKLAAADGLSMLVTPSSVLTLAPHLHRQNSFDPFADLVPVRLIAQTSFVLAVGPLVPGSADSLEAFATWCRLNPQAANCANSGAGSMQHFLALLVAQDLRLPLTHVPFGGSAPSMQAVAGGQVAAAVGTEAAALPLARAGRIRVLAGTGLTRSEHLPGVPTFGEAGLARLVRREWFGVFVPGSTPAAKQAAVSGLLATALDHAGVRGLISKVGFTPDNGAPAQLAAALKSEHAFWGPIVKSSGFTLES